MVLKKRLDYGFNGYRVPVVPRAPRSIRGRGLHNKPVEDSKLCAFELLAAVAGKFLQESESSASSNVAEDKDQLFVHKNGIKQEQVGEDKAFGLEYHDRGSCVESAFVTEPGAQVSNLKSVLKELPYTEGDTVLEHASTVTNSYLLNEVGSDVKLEICNTKNGVEIFPSTGEGGSSDDGKSCDGQIRKSCVGDTRNVTGRQIEAVEKQIGGMTVGDTFSLKDPMELCVNNHALINSDNSVQLPLYGDHFPNTSSASHRNDVKVGVRDDDEKFFGCNKRTAKIRSFRSQSRVRKRVRKFLTSKYWKVATKLKDFGLSHTVGEMRPFYHNRKNIFTHERYQREAPFKKRKLFNHSSSAVYDPEASGESISNSTEKGFKGKLNDSARVPHKVSRISSSVKGHQAVFQSKDSHVKLSIKSFRVPELYIEVSESATVGSLKRMVLKAVSAVLGGGLHVGVLLQGKKVRDDNRTLLQAGISCSDNHDDLGFTLEPSVAQAPPIPKDAPFLLPGDSHQQLFRSPTHSVLESGFSNASFDASPVNNMDNHVKSNYDVVPSNNDIDMNEATSDSKALVAISDMNTEALAVVPMNQRPKRSEFSQRRTRRPFTVSEVEALVEAVEQLGTGRWRDVKMRAFDNADHRTYVDLKDKWKTLVHTASISPRQRRGEPVPQGLLDRVLAAHAYWSRHQSKQHGKHQIQAESLKILEAQVEGVGA